jgi:hypothetical protein
MLEGTELFHISNKPSQKVHEPGFDIANDDK